MISVISSLMKGDKGIVDKFVAADKFWEEFFLVHRDDNVETLADALGSEQTLFEDRLDWNRGNCKEGAGVEPAGYDEPE